MKINILNDTATVYADDMVNPVMIIDNLQLGLKPGAIGVRAFRPDGIYYSNFLYKIDNQSEIKASKPVLSPNIISDWKLSEKYSVSGFEDIIEYPDSLLENEKKWITPQIESSGLINITRYYHHETGIPPSCAILKTEITSGDKKIVEMNFGYSDAVAIFLNKKPLFWRNNAWRGRNMANGGWVDYNDAVFLNLKKGKNGLIVVVAEVFGGWGFQANINGYSNVKNGFNRE